MRDAVPFYTNRRHAFSLVELLLSMAILAMILVFTTSIVNQTTQVTEFASRQIKSGKNVGFSIQILERDLSQIVPLYGDRTVVLFNTDSNQNSKIAFLTKISGLGERNGRYTSVAYELSDYDLIRYCSTVEWENSQLLEATGRAAESENFDVVANNILRFIVVIRLQDGSLSPAKSVSVSQIEGKRVPQGYTALVFPDVRAIMVGVAFLDDKNIKLPIIPYMGGKLPNILKPLESPLDVWEEAVINGALNDFPTPVRNALQFSQKTYELSPL